MYNYSEFKDMVEQANARGLEYMHREPPLTDAELKDTVGGLVFVKVDERCMYGRYLNRATGTNGVLCDEGWYSTRLNKAYAEGYAEVLREHGIPDVRVVVY